MAVMAEDKKRKKEMWMWIAIGGGVIFVIAWFLCWIIIPAMPNEHCAGGGSSLSLAGGGCSPCPDCDGGTPECPDGQFYSNLTHSCIGCPFNSYFDTYYKRCFCYPGYIWNTALERCDPEPAPEGAGLDDCCPIGYEWDSKYMVCAYADGQILKSSSACSLAATSKLKAANPALQEASLIAYAVCPDNAYYDTYYGECVCDRGYTQDINTGCCLPEPT